MPNWCYTAYRITDSEEKIRSLEKEFNKALSANPLKADFGNSWLGNLLLHIGLDPVNGEVRCRGSITYIEYSDTEIFLDTETAWAPHAECIRRFVEKYAPDAVIVYTAEESGCGIYWTNDPDPDEEYMIDCWEPNTDIEILADDYRYWSEKNLKEALERTFKVHDTMENLLKRFEDEYSDYASIHRYEYVPLEDLA